MSKHRVDYLTARQEEILHVIRQAITDDGIAPTVAEIADRVGLRSWSSVHYQLRELESKGAIVREPHQHRGIRLA
ncbi:LexA family protein [Streptomyces sp. NPDC058737]|uniref:LexA family protein n=1 Tax=Streptomyces sp. NPDC058737 TaxID=3346617 RepID=UPI0036AAC041